MEQDNNYELNLSWQKKSVAFFNQLREDIVADKSIYLYCLITTILLYALAVYLKLPVQYSFTTYLETLYLACYSAGLVWCSYYYLYLLVRREKHPTKQFLCKLKTIIFPLSRTCSILILLLALNIVFSNYTFLKSIIPLLHPYGVDQSLIELDRWLHFGNDPWVITHAIFSSPWASLAINTAYNAWFFFYVGDTVFLCTVQEGTSVTLAVFTHVSADLDDQRQPICDRVFISRAVLLGAFER